MVTAARKASPDRACICTLMFTIASRHLTASSFSNSLSLAALFSLRLVFSISLLIWLRLLMVSLHCTYSFFTLSRTYNNSLVFSFNSSSFKWSCACMPATFSRIGPTVLYTTLYLSKAMHQMHNDLQAEEMAAMMFGSNSGLLSTTRSFFSVLWLMLFLSNLDLCYSFNILQ